MDNKALFYRVYANLPLHLRRDIIVVINDEPFTWNSARLEIENDTKTGELILQKLVAMGILKHNEKETTTNE